MRLSFKAAFQWLRATVSAAALYLLGGLIPIAGAVLMLCAPAPILIYAIGRPWPWRRMAAVIIGSAAIVGLCAGPAQGLGFALSFGLAATLIMAMVQRQWAFELIVFATTLAMMAVATVALLLWAGSPAALIQRTHDVLAAAISHTDGLYEKLGLGLADSRVLSNRVLALTTTVAPGLAAMLGAAAVLLNLGLVWRWRGKQGLGYPLFSGLTKWRTPEWLIWFLLASGFGLFIPLKPLQIAATNSFLLVAAIYFCHGLAIMAYYLQRLAMPSAVRGLIYVIALLQPIVAGLVCLAGIFDMWIDFRRLKPPSQEAGSFDDFF